jgi:hypothetical protein
MGRHGRATGSEPVLGLVGAGMRRALRAVGFGLVVLAVGLVAQPASASRPSNSADVIRRSVVRTARQGSARLAGEVDFQSTSLSGRMTFAGLGDFTGRQLSLNLDFSQLVQQPASVEMRVVDRTAYMDLGPILRTAHRPPPPELAGVEWVKLDLSQLGTDAAATAGAPTLGSDASSELETLQGVTNGSVQRLGRAEVRGAATTHYRADVDLDLALKRLPTALQDKVRNATKLFAYPHHLPVEVWIDGTGLVRRCGMSVTINPPHRPTVKLGMTFDFYDFGLPVAVQAPPSDLVTDYSTLKNLLPSQTNPSI